MNIHARVAASVICALAVCAASLLAGCTTQPVVIPDNLSAAETFQRAQDASDHGDHNLAIAYYSVFKEKHPEDKDRGVWASYEIAFAWHKLGKDAKAVGLLDELLKQYETETDPLPPAPRVLAQKLRDRLSETLKKTL